MPVRWCVVVMLGCGGTTATMVDTPRDDIVGVPAPSLALVEGYVRDKRTGATVPGVDVEVWLGAMSNGRSAAQAISDERGFFSLDVDPGSGFLFVHPGDIHAAPSLVLRAGTRIRIDVTVDPKELAESRATSRRRGACPSSPPGTIVEGHTTTQQDRDDLARTVLERSTIARRAIPDLALATRAGGPISVRIDVGPRRQLTANALPSNRFVLKTSAELQAEADHSNTNVGYVALDSIYSNGSCAVLQVGGDFVSPSTKGILKLCCCTADDMYEKRGSRWVFVRRLFEICS